MPTTRLATTEDTAPSIPVRRRRVVGSADPTAPKTTSEVGLQKQRMAESKKKFLAALDEHLGIISYAAAASGISRRNVYIWLDNDSEFLRAVREIEDKQIDFVERKLLENIKNGDSRCMVFYLATKGRRRGYSNRIEHVTPKDEPLQIKASVDVTEARGEMDDTAIGKAVAAAMKACPEAFQLGLATGGEDDHGDD